MWRPDDWDNPYFTPARWDEELDTAFEQGANAMLESLFSEACKYGKKWVLIKKANGEVDILLD